MDVSICVVGMHRSGTSMVARLLSECGVDFGAAPDLRAGDSFNPEGYWEDPRFMAVNERLLTASGGDWDFPAPMSLANSGAEKVRAAKLVESRAPSKLWGWKDPRTSLTLPFWRELLPELRAVVCVRNPLEVAGSLRQRNGHSQTYGLNIWLTYNQRLLQAMPKERRVVTHYDAWFADPGAELRRIVGLLHLPGTDSLLARAAATVKGGHRHHRFTARSLAEVSFNREVLETYRALCEEAGWDDDAQARWTGQAGAPPASTPLAWESRAQVDVAALELEAAQAANRDLWAQLQAAEARSRSEAAENGQRLQAMSEQLREQARALREKDRQLESKTAEAEVLLAQVGELARQLDAARQEWQRIRNGFGWPMLEELWKWRARLIPHGSLRDQAIVGGLRLVKSKLRSPQA